MPVDRRHRLLQRVAEDQTIHIGQLARELKVSEMTIRRDIGRLERDGFLRRTYGGATAHITKSLELAFNARALEHATAKRLIGMRAADLLRDVGTMFVGIGTTAEQFALYLSPRPSLLVITGSLPVASLLGSRPVRVVVLGGTVRRDELACIGPVAGATVRRYRAEVAVLGAAGLSAAHGITELDDETAEIHRLIIAQSGRLVIVADASKLGAVAPATVAPPEAIATLITDASPDHPELAAFRAAGAEVVPVGPTGDGRGRHARADRGRRDGRTPARRTLARRAG